MKNHRFIASILVFILIVSSSSQYASAAGENNDKETLLISDYSISSDSIDVSDVTETDSIVPEYDEIQLEKEIENEVSEELSDNNDSVEPLGDRKYQVNETIDKGECGDNVKWSVTSIDCVTGILMISGEGDMYDYSPTNLPEWFNKSYTDDIEKVMISENVTSVGDYALYGMKNLGSVMCMGKSKCTTIGNYSFARCPKISVFTQYDHVVSIGDGAFESCGLTEVKLTDNVENLGKGVFKNNTELTSFTVHTASRLSYLPDSTLAGCTKLSTVTLSSSVERIGEKVFDGCTALKKVEFTDSIKQIDPFAFSSCTSLSELTIPVNTKVLSADSFSNCSGLKTLTILSKDIDIKSRAFENCTALNELYFSNGTVKIAPDAFQGDSKFKMILIPSSALSAYTDITTVFNQDNISDCIVTEKTYVEEIIKQIFSSMTYSDYSINYRDFPTTLLINEKCKLPASIEIKRNNVKITSSLTWSVTSGAENVFFYKKYLEVTGIKEGTATLSFVPDKYGYDNTITFPILSKRLSGGVITTEENILSSKSGERMLIGDSLTLYAYPIKYENNTMVKDDIDVSYKWEWDIPDYNESDNSKKTEDIIDIAIDDNKCYIKALSEGKVEISAYITDEHGYKTRRIMTVSVYKKNIDEHGHIIQNISMNDMKIDQESSGYGIGIGCPENIGRIDEDYFVWTIEDPRVISLKSNTGKTNMVYGLSAGTSHIYVKSKDKLYSANCLITVKSPNNNPNMAKDPNLIRVDIEPSINPDVYDSFLIKGMTYTLPRNYSEIYTTRENPPTDIKWKTDNKNIVSISKKNVLKAKNITNSGTIVNVFDGETISSSSILYRIHIISPTLVNLDTKKPVSSTTLNLGEKIRLVIGGIEDCGNYYNVSWEISDNSIVECVDNSDMICEYSAIGEGSCKISVHINGKMLSCNIKVKGLPDIQKNLNDNSTISMYPYQTGQIKFSDRTFKMSNIKWESDSETLIAYNKKGNPISSGEKISYYQNSYLRITPAGKITAFGDGDCTVTATDSKGRKKSINLKQLYYPVNTVYINLNKKKTVSFPSINNKKAVWSSGDEKVTGDCFNGVICGLKQGSTRVACRYDPYETGYGYEMYVDIIVVNPALNMSLRWIKINKDRTSGTIIVRAGETINKIMGDFYQPYVINSNNLSVAYSGYNDNKIYVKKAGKATLSTTINGTKFTISLIVQ